MKKVLAILMALAVCGAATYTVMAAEVDEDTTVDTVVTVDAESEDTVDVVSALANDETANEIADKITESIANGSAKEDIADLYSTLVKYVGTKGFSMEDLQDKGAVREVLDKFLEDAGVNSDELNEAISNSVVANAALDLYYKPETTETTTTTEEPSEDVSIPDTGYKF